MSKHTPMTRAQALAHHRHWTERDRLRIAEDFDRWNATSWTLIESGWGWTIAVRDAADILLIHLSAGTVYYKGGRTRPGSVLYDTKPGSDNPDHVLRLDNHSPASGGPAPSVRRWNEQVADYVLPRLDGAPGIRWKTAEPIDTAKERGVLVRILADDDALALVQMLVDEAMRAEELTTAAPEWTA